MNFVFKVEGKTTFQAPMSALVSAPTIGDVERIFNYHYAVVLHRETPAITSITKVGSLIEEEPE